jgi:hypothetical protein
MLVNIERRLGRIPTAWDAKTWDAKRIVLRGRDGQARDRITPLPAYSEGPRRISRAGNEIGSLSMARHPC